MKKLYDVTVSFDPKDFNGDVKTVHLLGEFLFYKTNMTGNTDETGMVENDPKYPPEQYEDGMASIGGLYCTEMKLNPATGCFERSMKLPANVYCYSFLVNGVLDEPSDDPRTGWSNVTVDGGKKMGFPAMRQLVDPTLKGNFGVRMADPKNPPRVITTSGPQMNSELYVGTPEECPWVPCPDAAKRGTVTYMSYTDVNGDIQAMGIYLPAGYDKTKTYPLILVSHGGGGNEADWLSQGSINNIMDNLVAAGKTKEAILVCPNHSVYQWDFAKIAENAEKCIIPLIEKVFNVSKDVHDRAFCGLSMGSMTTLYMYMHRSEVYDYYGAFSGGIAPGKEEFTLEDPHLKEVTLMIGTAEEDIAYNERNIGVPPTIRAIKAKGLPYQPYFTTGSHDWYCWPQMFTHFAEAVLWK